VIDIGQNIQYRPLILFWSRWFRWFIFIPLSCSWRRCCVPLAH